MLASAVQAQPDGFTIVDLGCGDGNMIHALERNGLLARAGQIVGVDVSPLRIQRFPANVGYRGIVSAADRVAEIADDRVDLVLSTMVIEHVPDDVALLSEIRRMLKPGGWLFITSVIKLPGAWYFRRTPDGRCALDSTHVREYPSGEAFEQLVRGAGFEVEESNVSPLSFPVIHPLLRMTNRLIPVPRINKLFLNGGLLAVLERIKMPIPRYRTIETLARKSG